MTRIRRVELINCPVCGHAMARGDYCPQCGFPKSEVNR